MQCYRALEIETRKWEAREERLIDEIDRLGKELQETKAEREIVSREVHVTPQSTQDDDADQSEVLCDENSRSSSGAVQQSSSTPLPYHSGQQTTVFILLLRKQIN